MSSQSSSEIASEILSARNKMKAKFQSTRTGGKGSFRRKRKNRSNIKSSRITAEERDFNRKIDTINKYIVNLKGDEKELWESYLEDYLFETCVELSRKDIKKKSAWTLETIKEDWQDFYNLHYFEETMGYYLFKKNWKFLKQVYSEQGYDYQLNFYEDLRKILEKKEYKSGLQAEADEITDVNDLLELLELPKDQKPKKDVLKKAYWKKSMLWHPDKHPDEVDKYTKLFSDVEKAYRNIKKYYYRELPASSQSEN